MVENKKRIDDLIQRRDVAQGKVSRVQGRLDSARQDLAAVEADCKKKKLQPEDLEGTITKLETKFDQEATSLDKRIKKAEDSITPFLEE